MVFAIPLPTRGLAFELLRSIDIRIQGIDIGRT
jgi:hypothetical protein